MIGGARGIDAGAVGHGNTARAGRLDIDLLVTGRKTADNLEIGQNIQRRGIDAAGAIGDYRLDRLARRRDYRRSVVLWSDVVN